MKNKYKKTYRTILKVMGLPAIAFTVAVILATIDYVLSGELHFNYVALDIAIGFMVVAYIIAMLAFYFVIVLDDRYWKSIQEYDDRKEELEDTIAEYKRMTQKYVKHFEQYHKTNPHHNGQ